MIWHVWKLKRRTGSFFLLFSFLTLALLTETPSAHGQGASLDDPPSPPIESPSGEILGTVYRNRSAEPAPQVVVNIRSLASATMETVLTDSDGRFGLKHIPPGTYEISASGQGYGSASAVVEVNSLPREVTLHLDSSAPSARGENSDTVSFRELKIPPKAQNEYNRGLDLLAKNDFARSLAHFSKAAAIYPDYYEAIYYIGLVELSFQHEDKAIQAFQKALDLSAGHFARAQFAYGLILCDERKPQEAERLIRRGLETDRDSAEGHLFLGIALLDQNRLDEAEKSLREALLRTPTYAGVYLALADVHGRKKDYRSQIEDLDAYLKLAPSSAASADVRRVRENAMHLSAQSAPASSQN
jgi:tetratricopeptide (TPR) repeat protein